MTRRGVMLELVVRSAADAVAAFVCLLPLRDVDWSAPGSLTR